MASKISVGGGTLQPYPTGRVNSKLVVLREKNLGARIIDLRSWFRDKIQDFGLKIGQNRLFEH